MDPGSGRSDNGRNQPGAGDDNAEPTVPPQHHGEDNDDEDHDQVHRDTPGDHNHQAEQRRRLLVMLIALCALAFLLSDPDTSGHKQPPSNSEPKKDPLYRPWETKVNSQKLKNSSIADVLSNAKKTTKASFPSNVTGTYRGSWTMSDETHKAQFGSGNISVGVAFSAPLPSWTFPPTFASRKRGPLLVRLTSYPSGLKGVLAVAGSMRMEDGKTGSGRYHNVPYLRGLYIVPTGEITLAYSPTDFRMVLLGPHKNISDMKPPKKSKKKRLMERRFSSQRDLSSSGDPLEDLIRATSGSRCAIVVRGILGSRISHSDEKEYRQDVKNIPKDMKKIDVDKALNMSAPSFHSYDGIGGIGPGIRQIRGQILSPNCVTRRSKPNTGNKTFSEPIKFPGAKAKLERLSVMNFTSSALIIDKYAVESKAVSYALLEMGCTLTQMVLQLQQLIVCASAQASAMRMSLFSLGMNGVIDAYITLMFLLVGLVREALFSAFLTLAFLKLLQFSVLELRLMMMIWKARHPEGFSQGTAALRRSLGKLYLRFYSGLLAAILLTYIFIDNLEILIFLMSSYWVPQVLHNIEQGQADGYTLRYIIAITITRLFMPLYFLGCPYNFLRAYIPTAGNHVAFSVGLVAWTGLQVGMLLLQRKYGARFFIPKVLLPQEYDYHRPITVRGGRVVPTAAYPAVPLNQTSEEASSESYEGVGRCQRIWLTLTHPFRRRFNAVRSYCQRVYSDLRERRHASGSRGYTRVEEPDGQGDDDTDVVVDTPDLEAGEGGELQCLICMCEIERPLRRQDYMVTPCNHLFHAECLQRWLDVKLECPTCRHSVPPVAN